MNRFIHFTLPGLSRIFLVACVPMLVVASHAIWAQTISVAEYFFDTDPGNGNGIPLTIASPADVITLTETISTTGLAPGYHVMFVRTQTSDGLWSLFEPREFVIEEPIRQVEYFFDQDPGVGNGIPLIIAPDQTTVTGNIPTSSLPDGDHFLFVRTRHEDDEWSLSDPIAFYIQTRIVEAEYFIDTDPGFGTGTPIPVPTPSDLVNLSASISVGSLTDGDHFLFVRTKDIFGNWSLFEPQLFTVNSVLPVELIDFKARRTDENRVRLTWTTLTEINNDFFSIQHSTDGSEFREIARIKGAGTTTSPQHYSTLHQPVNGINYYLLKQFDFDGHATYSRVTAIKISNESGPLIYPNPATDEWFIDFSGTEDAGGRTIELFDLNGRKCLELSDVEEQIIKLKKPAIAAGAYTVRITTADGVTVRKMIFY